VPVGESLVDEAKEEGDVVEGGVGGPPASCHAAAEGHCLDGLPCQQLVCYPPQGAAAAIVGDAAPQLLARKQRLPGQRQAPLQGRAGGQAAAAVGSKVKIMMMLPPLPTHNSHDTPVCFPIGVGATQGNCLKSTEAAPAGAARGRAAEARAWVQRGRVAGWCQLLQLLVQQCG
jgi:hypothetical protein